MKPSFYLGILILAVLLLAGCAMHYPYPATDLTKEYWQYSVQNTPESWKNGASAWFLRGKPSPIQFLKRYPKHMRVPSFDRIKVDGNFQVQLFGTDEQNSVEIDGPDTSVRALVITVKDGLLSLTQVTPATAEMKNVIVRIGVRELHQLIQCGCSKIEGISLNSDHLIVNGNPGGGW